MKAFLILCCLLAPHAFAQVTGAGSSSGIGNPAATFCLKNGGKISTLETTLGQQGNCTMKQRRLYRTFIKNGVDPVEFMNTENSFDKPKTRLCIAAKGIPRTVTTSMGKKEMCEIEEWTLFRIFL